MPGLRRSTRSSSAKPVPVKAAVKIASTKPRSQPSRKRGASLTRDSSPAPKRTRTEAKKSERAALAKPLSKPLSRTKAAGKQQTRALPATQKQRKKLSPVPEAPPPQQKPYFNPLPTPSPKQRPGLLLWAWGAGNFGQFGMGPDLLGEFDKPKKNTWVEQKVQTGDFGEDGAGLEAIAAGGLHTMFIDEKGTVWTCGVNDDAALGRVTKDVPDPSNPGSFLSIDDLTSVPHPLRSLVNQNFRAVKISAGDSISAAVSAEGELRVWGTFRANEGSLGFSNGLKHQFSPVSILDLSHKPGDVEKVSSIASGNNHLLVLTTHGNIYTWGAGEQSQLGRKVLERRKIHGTVPEKITLGNRARRAVVVGAGNYHSFAVDDTGDVWGWGLNNMGQTGTGYSGPSDGEVQLPTKVKGLSKEDLGDETIVEIAGGEHHTLFLTSGGRVFACGRSNAGQLGLADDDEALKDRADPDYIPIPVQVKFSDKDDPVKHISAGLHNSMAVTEGGALYAWGQGTQGELGVPDVEVKTPRVIVRKEGGSWTAVQVACGGQHTLGLFRKKSA